MEKFLNKFSTRVWLSGLVGAKQSPSSETRSRLEEEVPPTVADSVPPEPIVAEGEWGCSGRLNVMVGLALAAEFPITTIICVVK